MRKHSLVLSALAVAAVAAIGGAQIEQLTLDQMVAKTDNAASRSRT